MGPEVDQEVPDTPKYKRKIGFPWRHRWSKVDKAALHEGGLLQNGFISWLAVGDFLMFAAQCSRAGLRFPR